jgi:hypothetical protein
VSRRNALLQQDPVSPRGDRVLQLIAIGVQEQAAHRASLQLIAFGITERQAPHFAINCT